MTQSNNVEPLSSYDLTLRRLEDAMGGPDRLLARARPAVMYMEERAGKGQSKPRPYWRCGPPGYGVTALTEEAANAQERRGVLSSANITQGLARIPWC